MKIHGFLLILVFASSSYGAKILGIFPFPSKSHLILGSALLKELANRGHEVTMISPFPLKNPPPNYTDIPLIKVLENQKNAENFLKPEVSKFQKLTVLYELIKKFDKYILEEDGVVELLNSGKKFDVCIQLTTLCEFSLGIGYKLNATPISFSQIGGLPGLSLQAGVPIPYAYVPNAFLPFTDNMTFLQRVGNTIVNILVDIFTNFILMPHQRSVVKKYFPDAPPLDELIDNIDLYLINSHFVTETPRPYLPNTIQIGGFHLQEKEDLPGDVRVFLNRSKFGVIYFSLGTNVKTSHLPTEALKIILKTFSKSKYDILWKYDEDLPDKPINVKISKWLPQKSVLAHHKVIAFITHGGMGSTVESIYYGVPMIFLPFYGDQQTNSENAVAKGYGINLNIREITEESFAEAVREITENKKYSENIKLRSDMYKNQEINPMDKAIYWVEHVIKYKGAKHLKSQATYLSWYQYMLIDVFALIGGVMVLSFIVGYFLLKKLFSILLRNKKTDRSSNFKAKVKNN